MRFLIFCILSFSCCGNIFAQINVNKLKEKAKEKAAQAAEKKINEKAGNGNSGASVADSPKEGLGLKILQEDGPKVVKYTGYAGKLPPATYTNDYGKKVGQILFSKRPITYGKEDKKELTNVIKAGESVFGMAYLSDTKINLGFERGYGISIADEEDSYGYTAGYTFGAGPYTKKADGTSPGDQNYYDLDIFASYDDAWDKGLAGLFLQRFHLHLINAPTSPYGTKTKKIHKLKVELSNYEGMTIAEGTIFLDLTEGQEKITAMHNTHKDAATKAFKLPASKRNDPALAARLKKIMEAEGVNVLQVVFSTADWGLVRHNISGNILRRTIWAYVVYKNAKGECHYDDVQFSEEYIGGKFSGTIKKQGYGTAHGQLSCDNIK